MDVPVCFCFCFCLLAISVFCDVFRSERKTYFFFWVDPGQTGSTHLTRDPIIGPGRWPGRVLKLCIKLSFNSAKLISIVDACMRRVGTRQMACLVADKVRTRCLTCNHAPSFHLYFRFWVGLIRYISIPKAVQDKETDKNPNLSWISSEQTINYLQIQVHGVSLNNKGANNSINA